MSQRTITPSKWTFPFWFDSDGSLNDDIFSYFCLKSSDFQCFWIFHFRSFTAKTNPQHHRSSSVPQSHCSFSHTDHSCRVSGKLPFKVKVWLHSSVWVLTSLCRQMFLVKFDYQVIFHTFATDTTWWSMKVSLHWSQLGDFAEGDPLPSCRSCWGFTLVLFLLLNKDNVTETVKEM